MADYIYDRLTTMKCVRDYKLHIYERVKHNRLIEFIRVNQTTIGHALTIAGQIYL